MDEGIRGFCSAALSGDAVAGFPVGALLALCAAAAALWISLRHWRRGLAAGNDSPHIDDHTLALTRLAAIVESSDDAIISKTLQGIITSWNPGAERLFGYAAEEALGQPMLMLMPDDRRSEEADILARIAQGEKVEHFETVRRRKDGSFVDVSATISPIRDRDGQVVGASKIARDISERKHSRAKLEAQIERLHLLDQITAAIAERQDLQSIYQVVLRRLEDRLPVDFSCVCGLGASDGSLTVLCVGAGSGRQGWQLKLWEGQQLAIEANGLSRCVAGELVHEPDTALGAQPLLLRLADGGLRSLVAVPLRLDATLFGVLLVCRRDAHAFVSGECEFLRQLAAHVALAAQQASLYAALRLAYEELRLSQQAVMQQERLRALGQMASGVAHDINNAISPVLLYAESLLEHEPGLSPRARHHLETIARSMDDVAATVARLREFYRQREPAVELVRLQLAPLLSQVVELTRARWHDMPLERGIVIRLQLEQEDELPDVMGIESEIREALINLILNAVDAMPEGGELQLRAAVSAPAGASASVELRVRDSGVGMDEDTRRRCMEPFFTTKGERGTGMGLAMVYGIAQRHGAELSVSSQPGAGTTVSLSFPLAPAPAGPPGAEPAARPELRRSLKLLVVDDDPVVLGSMTDTLSAEGHVVTRADGGQAGIDAFRAASGSGQPFDIVITDLGMPYVDGRQVAHAVKHGAAPCPVILVTGWGQRMSTTNELPADVDLVLGKPPRLRDLQDALRRLTEPAAAPETRGAP